MSNCEGKKLTHINNTPTKSVPPVLNIHKVRRRSETGSRLVWSTVETLPQTNQKTKREERRTRREKERRARRLWVYFSDRISSCSPGWPHLQSAGTTHPDAQIST